MRLALRLNGGCSAGIWQDMGSSKIRFRCNWGTALCMDSSGYGWPIQMTILKAYHPHWSASSTTNAICHMLPSGADAGVLGVQSVMPLQLQCIALAICWCAASLNVMTTVIACEAGIGHAPVVCMLKCKVWQEASCQASSCCSFVGELRSVLTIHLMLLSSTLHVIDRLHR